MDINAGSESLAIGAVVVTGSLNIVGRLRNASNATFQVRDESGELFVYKPAKGEAPLWDFPDGSLTGREIASASIDRLLGINIIPPTVWLIDGPLGAGMIQQWIHEVDSSRPVNVFDPREVPHDWLPILSAQDAAGNPLIVAHENNPRLAELALLDAVLNNADRKAGHIMKDESGRIWAIDHGVCLHRENKLRTVLWGWAGSPLDDLHLKRLTQLQSALNDSPPDIDRWITQQEKKSLRTRVETLLQEKYFPEPTHEWPAIPWPVF